LQSWIHYHHTPLIPSKYKHLMEKEKACGHCWWLTRLLNLSLTLEVAWSAIPKKQQQGKLLGYKISYTNERSGIENITDVGPDKIVHTITGLEFASYAVKLAGYTGAGVGIFTDLLKRFPLEGGKKKLPRNLLRCPFLDGHSEFSSNTS